jgi:hypothetical protein
MDDDWLYVEGQRDGREYMAAVRVPFGPSRWPAFDHQVTLVLRYAPHWRTGLPKPKELTRLQDFEDGIIAAIGSHGAVVATETTDMRRTIHVRVPAGPLLDTYRASERENRKGALVVTVEHDPAWTAVAHLAEVAARAAA